ncbi:MAG: endonuclease/exonuclease/phosphatase, partial [Sediminibacterium sp.]|nr:endonuclease/exonuclease/phosphatase [Sediminibacterium sp.]
MKWSLIILICLVLGGQEKKPIEVAVIGFYNLENLYDTIDNPIVNDDEFTPNGGKHYSGDIYINKLFQLAFVLKDFGVQAHPRGAAIIGVAEIENDTVLNDLVNHFLL